MSDTVNIYIANFDNVLDQNQLKKTLKVWYIYNH